VTSARELPGTSAARHGAGDADLSVMLAAHAAFRRDLARLARVAEAADLRDPARLAAVQAGWDTFKRQLHLHHTAEDDIVWPALRRRLEHSDQARSVLDQMEDEHELIDPLLDAVDGELFSLSAGIPGPVGLAGATGALTSSLAAHLGHEERDALPLIGVALTAGEWRSAGLKIARANRLSQVAEMFAWLAEAGDPDGARAVSALPPPARLVYRVVWKPRYQRTPRW
jgi:hypothetical protein